MTDFDKKKLTGYEEGAEIEHDEFHSALEVDDTSGWRVFIVPGLAILFLIGAVTLFLLSGNDTAPDPRVAAQIRAKEEARQAKRAESDAARAAAMAGTQAVTDNSATAQPR
jgi:hypothetical protein